MERKNNQSCILIGAGPSLEKNKHLELLAKSKYKGMIMIPEILAEKTILRGITPDKFNIYYFTLEEHFDVSTFLNIESVLKWKDKISVYCSNRTIEKSKNFIESNFRRLIQIKRKEANETSNVGLFMMSIAFQDLGINEVCLIGMDHSTHEWETEKIAKDSEIFKLCFKEIFNPFTNEMVVLNPIHQVWHEQFYYFIEKYFDGINLINCTEGGSLIDLKNEKFGEWLDRS